ncbi:MAG: DUF1828 domain-containing protein [Chloroflexota bacterium]|nr:DUF1828 domain-containing protein [Chloroflexota bacterium]
MEASLVEKQFRDIICEQVRLQSEGVNRYHVFTPFRFEDGDHLVVVLKQEGDRWFLTDEGHTYMHLTYEVDEADFERGTRQQIITNAIALFSVLDVKGELRIAVQGNQFGNALYSFVQALLKISDVTFLSRERTRSTFVEDFRALITAVVPEQRRRANWYDVERDREGKYSAPWRINGTAKPLLVYPLQNDDQARDATICLQKYEIWGLRFTSLGVFENQEEINRAVLARFSDVCGKLFSSLVVNRDRIAEHIRETVHL